MLVKGIRAFIEAFKLNLIPSHCRWCGRNIYRLANGVWVERLAPGLFQSHCEESIAPVNFPVHEVD